MPGATEMPPTTRVAVIIAFFQRRTGLLLTAVRSALAQSAGDIRIVVIDDGSPVSARAELAALSGADLARVVVIEQANAGPGAARNRGIAAVPADTDYIAFLDSDDQWTRDHIARALDAFARDADFYFTDYVPLLADRSAFDICGLRADDPAHAAAGEGLHVFGGDLFDALLRRAPVGTSTVVYRRRIGARHAFPTDFSYGEDVFFWMLLTRDARKVMFSPRPGAVYGAGVNIAAGAKWGTPSSLPKLYSEYRFHHRVTRTFALSGAQMAWSGGWRDEISRSFVRGLLHLVRRREPVDWRCVARFFSMNPGMMRYIIKP
jgi:succinoglycan biosynthesis protein ExoW